MSFPQLSRLLEVLTRLRGPQGCPWDRAQTPQSAARWFSDEVHEFVEQVENDALEATRDELADLLYMLAFNWLLLHERSGVEFDALAGQGADKLIRRHPHVFGEASAQSVSDSNALWNAVKAQEGGAAQQPSSLLKELPASVSPLRQATAHGDNAASVGFDWDDADQVVVKLHEELGELQRAVAAGDVAATEEELGDLLFAVSQLARKLSVDPDRALRRTNSKFARRFRAIEARHGYDSERLRARGVAGMMRDWEEIKRQED
jgi:MazG family protein